MDTLDYWKKKEKEVERKWNQVLSSSPIEWITREAFWKLFEEEYEPNNRYLTMDIEFPIMLEELRQRIKVPPVFTLLDEDFPGPVERWYGKIETDLFILTHYYHRDYPEMTMVRIEDKKDFEELVLKSLNDFKLLNP